jgi:hypothetical protein
LDFGDLESERGRDPFLPYSRSKLANLLFTYELARRHGDALVVMPCIPARSEATWVACSRRSEWLSKTDDRTIERVIDLFLAAIAAPTTDGGLHEDRAQEPVPHRHLRRPAS